MHHHMGFNHALLAGGINYGMVSYGHSFNDALNFAGHVRYVAYGNMVRRDELGNEQGNFSAGDFALGAGVSKILNEKITIGANLNVIYSQLENYSSVGLTTDLAATYKLGNEGRSMVAVMVKNAGLQLKSYTSGNREAVRADAQIALSHKLAHAPFRVSVVAHDLNRWNLSYFDASLAEV